MAHASVIRRRGNQGWLYQFEPTTPKKSRRDQTFVRFRLFGMEGRITWGYHTAADIASWSVAKNDKGEWTLTATATQVNAYALRQTQPTPLFTAPRIHDGLWCWPIQEITVHGATIRARLGPIEF